MGLGDQLLLQRNRKTLERLDQRNGTRFCFVEDCQAQGQKQGDQLGSFCCDQLKGNGVVELGRCGGTETCLSLGYILKLEPIGVADQLDVGWEICALRIWSLEKWQVVWLVWSVQGFSEHLLHVQVGAV